MCAFKNRDRNRPLVRPEGVGYLVGVWEKGDFVDVGKSFAGCMIWLLPFWMHDEAENGSITCMTQDGRSAGGCGQREMEGKGVNKRLTCICSM